MHQTFWAIFLISLALAKEEELPLCPTNVDYFPQNLPMHCRMPRNADITSFAMQPGTQPGMQAAMVPAPLPPPFYQSPPSEKQPSPVPLPLPPGIPPPILPPGPLPGAPIPIQMSGPAHKLPVIVMPFYSPDPSFKKPGARPTSKKHGHARKRPRRPTYYDSSDTDSSIDTDTDTDTDTDWSSDTEDDGSAYSSKELWWKAKHRGWRKNARRMNKKRSRKSKNKKKNKKADLLTPILQYVTKDGYVIFEKQISKNEAKDWLKVNKDDDTQAHKQDTKIDRDNLNVSIQDDRNEEEGNNNVNRNEMTRNYDNGNSKEEKNGNKSREEEKYKEVSAATTRQKKHRHQKPNLLLERDKPNRMI